MLRRTRHAKAFGVFGVVRPASLNQAHCCTARMEHRVVIGVMEQRVEDNAHTVRARR